MWRCPISEKPYSITVTGQGAGDDEPPFLVYLGLELATAARVPGLTPDEARRFAVHLITCAYQAEVMERNATLEAADRGHR